MPKRKTKTPARIPMKKWGKDHWSLMGYVHSCVAGREGVLQHDRMRCNVDRHPLLAGPRQAMSAVGRRWNPEWGTRLKGYFDTHSATNKPSLTEDSEYFLPQYDDWDCLDDLETAGLIEIYSLVNGVVTLTKKGWRVSKILAEFKGAGGQFANFVYPQPRAAPPAVADSDQPVAAAVAD